MAPALRDLTPPRTGPGIAFGQYDRICPSRRPRAVRGQARNHWIRVRTHWIRILDYWRRT